MKNLFSSHYLPSHMLVAISAWGSKIITAGVQVVIMRYLISYLGVNEYGTFAVIASLAGWLALTDCGFGTAFQNTLSVYRAKNTPYDGLLNQVRFVQYCLFILWVPLLILTSCKISNFLFSNMNVSTRNIILIVAVVNIVWMSSAIASISYKVLYALHRGILANVYPAIGSIITLLAIILLTKSNDVENKLFFAVLAYSLPAAISSIVANTHIKVSKWVIFQEVNWPDLRIIASNAWRFMGFALLVAAVTGLDYLIMARIIPPDKIASYTVVSKVFIFIYFMYYSILTAMWPVFTEMMTLENYKKVKEHLVKAVIFGILIVSIGTGLFVYFRDQIAGILSGNQVHVSTQTILIFGVYYLLRAWGDAFAVVIASVNKVRIFWIYMPFQAVIGGIIQYTLGTEMGIDGIILGIAISFLVTAVWINPLFLRHIVIQKRIIQRAAN